jgi:putative ABC transport system substrate-binding protein
VSRFFVLAVLLMALAAPGICSAQQAKNVWRVGYVSPYSAEFVKPWLGAFVGGMKDLGYTEGKHLVIEVRHSQGDDDRLSQLARELADLKIFVSSLARPGGNITGLSDMHSALGAKRLELLKELMPSASRFGILLDASKEADRAELERLQKAAPALQVRLITVAVSEPADIARVFEALKRERVDAFHILFGTAHLHLPRVTELARQHRLPNIVTTRRAAEAGALLSYGADFPDLYRRAATYVHKIFNGARPGDLPIEQPTKFELTVNLKAAKAMGLSIPPALLQRADQVIK